MITQLADVGPPERLGHAHHFRSRVAFQRRRIPLRFGVASLHRLGLGRRISLSSRASGLRNLRANALLALDGSLGHVTEVLSGDVYQPLSTSSPHQIWSAAMVVSPMLRGMLGLSTDAKTNTVTFSPHVPADWNSFSIRNVRAGNSRLNLTYTANANSIVLKTECVGSAPCNVAFKPAISLRAHCQRRDRRPARDCVSCRRRTIKISMSRFSRAVMGSSIITIQLTDDVGIGFTSSLPPLGSRQRRIADPVANRGMRSAMR